MKLTTVGIFFLIVACIFIWRILSGIKKDTVGIRSAITWIIIWFGIGFFSIFPEILELVMKIAQMKNRILFILLFGVFVLFAFIFHIDSRLDKIRQEIAKLTRASAILDFEVQEMKKEIDDNGEAR